MERLCLDHLRGAFIWFVSVIVPVATLAGVDLVNADGEALPIIVAADSGEANEAAARDLARIIEGITSRRPEVIIAGGQPLPGRGIWVGLQPAVEGLLAGYDLEFRHPEEILIINDGVNLLIAGRDRFDGGEQTEFGTANAVYTFMQRWLDVAWIWPGSLGEAYGQRDEIRLPLVEYRFHPPFRSRVFRYPRGITHTADINRWWQVVQRGRGSLKMEGSHAWGDWWDRYHEAHPEWFALKPDGERGPFPRAGRVKMCVSNAEIVDEWLRRVEPRFVEDPSLEIIAVTPNDGGGWCVCPECMAWDSPDGAPTELYGQPYVALTDRYVRFWNRLAGALRERFPDRPVGITTLAYSRYSAPPVDNIPLDNIVIGQVGHFPLNPSADRERQKAELQAWGQLASALYFRPNYFYWAGGLWGMPEVAMDETIEDFRFLAENRVFALDIDSAQMNYATLGPQLYVMAQFGYDPYQDGREMMEQYYRLGFGPAARTIEAYWDIFQQARRAMMDDPEFTAGSRFYGSASMPLLYRQTYPPELFAEARRLLDTAEQEVSNVDPVYRERIEFLRSGLDYTEVMVDIIELMGKIRRQRSGTGELAAKALELHEKRLAVMENAPPFALDQRRLTAQMARRGGPAILGPPSPEQLGSGGSSQKAPQFIFAKPAWQLVFEDNFDGGDFSDNWIALTGSWSAEDGWLSTGGGTLVSKHRFPGLQRVEFEVVTDSAAQDFRGDGGETEGIRVSDLSPLLHINETGTRSGYFLQFGGSFNTRNALRKQGATLQEHRDAAIIPGQLHHLVAELDGSTVRLTVDGDPVLEFTDSSPLLGPDHEQVGIYFYTAAKIKSIRVYTAEPVKVVNPEWDPNVDDPDFE